MPGVANKVHMLARLLRHRQIGTVVEKLRENVYSDSVTIGLRRDLSIPFKAPDALIPITIRPFRNDDASILLDPDAPGLDGVARYERMTRRNLLAAEIPTCYVAATTGDRPCYMQWLVGARDNDKIQDYWGDVFPILEPNEALLEGAFTPESYRGQRIMPAAMARIAERAADLGARWVVTFVAEVNSPSLKGCERSGFEPYLMKRVRWRLFRHTSFQEKPLAGSRHLLGGS